MFPVLIVECAEPGLLYINGAFCGELTEPQMLPIRPDGRVYVEYRALAGPAFPLAAALDLRNGRLSGAPAASVYAVQWPDRVIALELRPSMLPRATAPRETLAPLSVGPLSLYHQRQGQEEAICMGDMPLFAVPSGTLNLRAQPVPSAAPAAPYPPPHPSAAAAARPPFPDHPAAAYAPSAQSAPSTWLLMGEQPGGASAWLLDAHDPADPALIDQVHAQQLALEGDGALRALQYADDLVGHAHLSTYRLSDGRFLRQSRQHSWMPGAPRWPQSERDTLRAYAEALLVGAHDEAQSYLTPAARDQAAHQALAASAAPSNAAHQALAASAAPSNAAHQPLATSAAPTNNPAFSPPYAPASAAPNPAQAAPLAFQAVVPLPRPLLAPPPDHPHAIGLLEAQSPNLGVVRALCARLIPSQHAQGRYLIDSLKLLET